MSTVLILTPVIISSWPAISAAAVGAAAALGLAAKETVSETLHEEVNANVNETVVVELAESEVVAQNMATDQEIVLTRDTLTLKVSRDARGRCQICASGKGYSKAELEEEAEAFMQKMTQCFVYNRVTSELGQKGFKVVNEEMTEDESVRLHIRKWEE